VTKTYEWVMYVPLVLVDTANYTFKCYTSFSYEMSPHWTSPNVVLSWMSLWTRDKPRAWYGNEFPFISSVEYVKALHPHGSIYNFVRWDLLLVFYRQRLINVTCSSHAHASFSTRTWENSLCPRYIRRSRLQTWL
jgi:hypothetical protein